MFRIGFFLETVSNRAKLEFWCLKLLNPSVPPSQIKICQNVGSALRILRKWKDSLFWHYHDPLYCAQSSGSRIKLSKKEWRKLQRLLEYDPQPTRDARIFKKQSALFHFMRAYSLETLESTERLHHRWLRENHKTVYSMEMHKIFSY